MNERQASENGYTFTGCYSHDKEEQKKNAEELRKKYSCKAIVVNCPPNPLSRGHHGMGYSVYADEKYRCLNILESINNSLITLPSTREYYHKQYLEKVAELDKQQEQLNNRKKEFEEKLNWI